MSVFWEVGIGDGFKEGMSPVVLLPSIYHIQTDELQE